MSGAERWAEIKARSTDESGCYCAPCYFAFVYGVRHPEGGGYPCVDHATAEERREVGAKINEALAYLESRVGRARGGS